MSDTLLFKIIIAVLLFQFAVETFLNYLNARRFADPIPDELSDVFDKEAYRKSQEYKHRNYRFGLVSAVFSLLLTLGFLIFGGFEWVDQQALGVSSNPILRALIFFGIILLGSDLLSTPFSWYQTFVIEEKFGFNKTTPGLFILDKIKGWLLLLVLGGGMLALVIWFYNWAGASFWLYAWGLIAIFSIVINLLYSRLIVPIFNKQTPLEEGSLRNKIKSYAQDVGFELRHIYVIDGSKRSTKANAYFSGFGREKRVTLFDTLLSDLEEDEIVSVLAHEVGHYKRHHILVNLFVSILLTGFTLYLLSIFINNPDLSLSIGVSQPSFHAGLIGFGILYSPISELSGLVMNYFSRKFEYQADNYASKTFHPDPLITSLKKLSKNSLSNLTPHPAYVFVHYSHPPLINRILNLKA